MKTPFLIAVLMPNISQLLTWELVYEMRKKRELYPSITQLMVLEAIEQRIT
jgi:hypothetical protein